MQTRLLRLPRLNRPLLAAVCITALGGCAPEFGDYAYGGPYTQGSSAQRSAAAKLKIPLPDRALLSPQPAPDCDTPRTQQRTDNSRKADTTATAALTKPSIPDDALADPNADLALRIKLEYERECYRSAEARARERLQQLQTSTAQTIKSVQHAEQKER